MHRNILLVLAGLCLALLGTACGNEGPIAPPIHIGDITIVDDGDGQLIGNEPVMLSWEFYPRIDYWQTSYSTDGGQHWVPSDRFSSNVGVWKIPENIDTDTFTVKVEGWKDCRPAPRVSACSELVTVASFCEPHSLYVKADPVFVDGITGYLALGVKDKYGNYVKNFIGTVSVMGTLTRSGVGIAGMIINIGGASYMPDSVNGLYFLCPATPVWHNGTADITVLIGPSNVDWVDGLISFNVSIDTLTGYDESQVTN